MAHKINSNEFKEHIDVEKVFDHYGIAYKGAGSRNIRSKTFCHGGDNPTGLVFNTEEKVGYCHTHCGGMDIIALVEKVEDCTFPEAIKILSEMFDIEVTEQKVTRQSLGFSSEKVIKAMKRLNERRKEKIQPYQLSDMQFAKIKSFRGYDVETMEHFKIHLCTKGELADRVVCPLYDLEGNLVGMTGRTTKEVDKATNPKWMHIPKTGLKMSWFMPLLVNNRKFIEEKDEVIVVEGVFDCAKLFQAGIKNTVSPIGTYFSEQQAHLCARHATKMVLAMDADDGGQEGMKRIITNFGHLFDMYVMEFPYGKDADDCTVEELQEAYKRKIRAKEWLKKIGG